MINELYIYVAIEKMKLTILKLNISIDEIRQKNPQRVDLIDSMTKSSSDVSESLLTLRTLEKEYRASSMLSNNLTYQNLQLIQELNEIKRKKEENEVNLAYITNLERENERLKKDLETILKEI